MLGHRPKPLFCHKTDRPYDDWQNHKECRFFLFILGDVVSNNVLNFQSFVPVQTVGLDKPFPREEGADK
jgi:hypothetical protein